MSWPSRRRSRARSSSASTSLSTTTTRTHRPYWLGAADVQLRRRIQLLFVALFVILVAGTALDSIVEGDADRAAARVNEQLVPARDELQLLLTSLVDQETGQRGFLLTGRQAFLEPYEEGLVSASRSLTRLRQLLADDPDALAGVDRVR